MAMDCVISQDGFTRWTATSQQSLARSSRFFAQRFADQLLTETMKSQMKHLHVRLRALGIPSDYVRIIDGITPMIGESLLIHICVTVDRDEFNA